MGRTVSHRRIICCKAYLEGKPTHIIARETFHSPEAVDHYILGLARVHFATLQRGMTPEETPFAIQQPLSIVQQYVNLIEEFALDDQRVYDRVGVQLSMCDGHIEPSIASDARQNESGVLSLSKGREQEPTAG